MVILDRGTSLQGFYFEITPNDFAKGCIQLYVCLPEKKAAGLLHGFKRKFRCNCGRYLMFSKKTIKGKRRTLCQTCKLAWREDMQRGKVYSTIAIKFKKIALLQRYGIVINAKVYNYVNSEIKRVPV